MQKKRPAGSVRRPFWQNVSRETGLKAKNAKSVDQTLPRHRPAAILEKPGKGIGRAEKGTSLRAKLQ